MFQWISIISFAAVIAGIILHHSLFPCGYPSRFSIGSLIRKKVHLFTLLFPPQTISLAGKIRKFIFLIGLLSFVVLLLTGFVPVVLGCRLKSWWLMLHATFAPVFIGCAALVGLLGAGQYAFNRKDAESMPCGCGHQDKKPKNDCWLTDTGIGAKAGFWALLFMAVPVTMTMVLSMLPLFGPDIQELLFILHRYSALIFALIALVELYILIRIEILKDTKTT